MRILMAIIVVMCSWLPTAAQLLKYHGHDHPIPADSAKKEINNVPFFSLYKDNYFIFGPPIGTKPTAENTNAKFQISIRIRLTKSVLPWDTYLYLFYTQKAIWNVLENSLPMTDLNFNPGIGIAKPLFRNDKYVGRLMLQLEHESNGRDSIFSRSWNRISFGGDVLLTNNLLVHGKFWIPLIDGVHNKDILQYAGFMQAGVELITNNKLFKASAIFVKRWNWRLDFNTIVELSWQLSKKLNFYLFAQYYNGYGENLLDYNQFRSQLRVGIAFKPIYFSDY